MKTLAILQARMSSQRLPGKVIQRINNKPMIFWQVKRILNSRAVDELIVATSSDISDDLLVDFLENEGILVFRGSLDDVHSRFLTIITSKPQFDAVVRLTGDCPLVMPQLIDECVREFRSINCDYLSNSNPPTYPDGLDIEVFKTEAFLRMSELTLTEFEKEHVTPKFRLDCEQFRCVNHLNKIDQSSMRWTVDYPQDFVFVSRIFEEFRGREEVFTMDEVIELLDKYPDLDTQLPGNLRNFSTVHVERSSE